MKVRVDIFRLMHLKVGYLWGQINSHATVLTADQMQDDDFTCEASVSV